MRELLYYFAMTSSSGEFAGQGPGLKQFSAVSKVPWLTALVAWREIGTYTPGCHFVPGGSDLAYLGEPQHGSAAPLLAKYGLARNESGWYATERRTGWITLDHGPGVALAKLRPTGPGRLLLNDPQRGPNPPGLVEDSQLQYAVELEGSRLDLPDVAWADWDKSGRLLVVTTSAACQVRSVEGGVMDVAQEQDLRSLDDAPRSSPDWARSWWAISGCVHSTPRGNAFAHLGRHQRWERASPGGQVQFLWFS